MTMRLLLDLSSRWRGRKLATLIFHRVLPAVDPLQPDEMDARRFDELCGWLRGWFNVLPLDEAARRLASGTLPPRALAITFDDGYRDNCEVALAILRRHGLCATFFIATGYLDGGRMWNDTLIEAIRTSRADALDLSRWVAGAEAVPLDTPDARRRAVGRLIGSVKYLAPGRRPDVALQIAQALGATLPDDLMMSSSQVAQLRHSGMQIGAHTVNHPILALLDAPAIRREMADSKAALELIIGEPVTMFAYPNGKPGADYRDEAVQAARELGFQVAVSTAPGVADRRSDPLQLPRFTPWDRQRARFGARIAAALARGAQSAR